MNTIHFPKKRYISAKFIKFLLVGASGTLIDYGILLLLKSFGWQTLPANVISYSAGLVNNYYWNSHWTFVKKEDDRKLEQFCQFAIISLVGLGLNSLIVLTLEPRLNGISALSEYGLILAKMIATGIVLVWNYTANQMWTFQTGK